jgi:hypothetical protein
VSDVSGRRSLTGSPSPPGPQSLTDAGGQWPESPGVFVHAKVPDLALPGMPAPREVPPAVAPADDPAPPDESASATAMTSPLEPTLAETVPPESTLWPDWPVRIEALAAPADAPEPAWPAGADATDQAEVPGTDAAGGRRPAWFGDEIAAGDPDDVPWSVTAYDEQAYEGYGYGIEGPPAPSTPAPGSDLQAEPEPQPDPRPVLDQDSDAEPDRRPVLVSSADGSVSPAELGAPDVHPDGPSDGRGIPAIVRGDLIAELAGRLEQLDQLLGRLEEAKREAADASEHLLLTRRWQEETVRTIKDERARMRQRQHALDELADRARAAVEAMQATYRTLPREVIELAIELQVLDRAGFITKRAPRSHD